jgi:hypothetical protein
MKTTIELSDALFNSAKALAQQRKVTMRALVEEGLRSVLSEAHNRPKTAFKLRDARVPGEELLISEPQAWQQLEDDHVIARLNKSR